jgi:glycosyltransferase involved in cell wall biosynthesis
MGKIYINARFRTQVLTGVQRYASEIIKRFPKEYIEIKPFKTLPGAIGHIWEQVILPLRVSKNAILWSPGGSGPISVSNQIITIHDVAPLDHPEWYNTKFVKWYKWLWPRLVKKVKHIITVSNYSRERIVKILNVPYEKITVIPLGVNKKFFSIESQQMDYIRNKYNLPEDYILTVSAISPRKNINRVIKAWEKINDDYNIPLVIVGKEGLYFAGSEKVIKSSENIIFTGYVPDPDLPFLYACSSVFVYASLYEGFGLPVLEAMAAGTPVVASKNTSLPEVAGDSAIFVDPYDEESIASGIRQIIENSNKRKELIIKGKKRALNFSWEKTAEETWKCIKQNE